LLSAALGEGGADALERRAPRLGCYAQKLESYNYLANLMSDDRFDALEGLHMSDSLNADPDLAGLLITGTGDVFAPGGDLGQAAEDNWMDFASTKGHGRGAVRRSPSVPEARGVGVQGLCQGGGLQTATCSHLAVVSDPATFRVPELFRGIADTYYSQVLGPMIGPVRTKDLMFTTRVVPRDELLDVAEELLTASASRTASSVRRLGRAFGRSSRRTRPTGCPRNFRWTAGRKFGRFAG
jgi:enoyl-CoA hydratase/carnithine racemase